MRRGRASSSSPGGAWPLEESGGVFELGRTAIALRSLSAQIAGIAAQIEHRARTVREHDGVAGRRQRLGEMRRYAACVAQVRVSIHGANPFRPASPRP